MLFNQYLDLFPLRQLASYLLAAAMRDLFPDARLLVGGADSLGFFYDFYFPHPVNDELLSLVEQRMHVLRKENISIKQMEMVPTNAKEYLAHLGQHFNVDDLFYEAPTTGLVKIGSIVDVCHQPILEDWTTVAFFQLIQVEQLGDLMIRICGTAFYEKNDLKKAIKAIKHSEKTFFQSTKEFFLRSPDDDCLIWLPKGRAFLQHIKGLWENQLEQEGFLLIETNSQDRKIADHYLETLFSHGEKDEILRVAEWREVEEVNFALWPFSPKHRFHEKIFCSETQVHEIFQSSLEEILFQNQQWELPYAIVLSGRGKYRSIMEKILQGMEIDFEVAKEQKPREGVQLQFYFEDQLGRFFHGPYLQMFFDAPKAKNAPVRYAARDEGSKNKISCDSPKVRNLGVNKGPELELSRRREKCSLCEKDRLLYSDGINYLTVERSSMGTLEDLAVMILERKQGHLPFHLSPEQVRIIPMDESTEKAEEILGLCLSRGLRARIDSRSLSTRDKSQEGTREDVPFLLFLKSDNDMLFVRENSSPRAEEMSIKTFFEKVETIKIETELED